MTLVERDDDRRPLPQRPRRPGPRARIGAGALVQRRGPGRGHPAACADRRSADAGLDGRRGAAANPRQRRGLVLQPLARRALAQGRDQRPNPEGGRDPHRLRPGRAPGEGRPAGRRRRLPHRRAGLLLPRGRGGRAGPAAMTLVPALAAFVAAAILITVTPGLDTALVLRTGAVEGPRRGALTALGVCCGLMVWRLAVALGLGVLLAASHAAYLALQLAGAAYLIWLGAGL